MQTSATAAVPEDGKAILTSIGDSWFLQLRQGSIYLEIDASSRDLALSAVRQLRAMS